MSQAVQHKFCPYCGKQLRTLARFCPKCGRATPVRQSGALAGRGAQNYPANPDAARPAPAEAQGTPWHVHSRGPREAVSGPPRRIGLATAALTGQLEQAGFGLRYGAWMFDFLITLIAIMSFTFLVTAVSRKSVVGSNSDLLLVAGLTLLLFVLNFVVFAGWGGQSVGMRILGIRIVRVDGRPFTYASAALRHLLGYPLSVAGFFLGFLWMLWDARQQAWHDKLAGTIVVMSR